MMLFPIGTLVHFNATCIGPMARLGSQKKTTRSEQLRWVSNKEETTTDTFLKNWVEWCLSVAKFEILVQATTEIKVCFAHFFDAFASLPSLSSFTSLPFIVSSPVMVAASADASAHRMMMSMSMICALVLVSVAIKGTCAIYFCQD
jgi:hypothetical protein